MQFTITVPKTFIHFFNPFGISRPVIELSVSTFKYNSAGASTSNNYACIHSKTITGLQIGINIFDILREDSRSNYVSNILLSWIWYYPKINSIALNYKWFCVFLHVVCHVMFKKKNSIVIWYTINNTAMPLCYQ